MKPAVWLVFLAVAASCRPPPAGEVAVPSLVVLPLENVSADPEESDYLAQGISRAVITKLTQAGLGVTPWDTARRYGDSVERVEDIARELKVDAALVGTFELVGDRMLTTLSLVDAKSGLQSWADEFEEPFEDVFEVQRRIALGAAKSLKQELTGEEETALAIPESRSAEAYDQYMQGAHIFQQGTEEATEIAFQYFNRALALDPELSEAHMALATVHYTRYVQGWGGAESLQAAAESYSDAIEHDPRNLRARRGVAYISFFRGRMEEALAQARFVQGLRDVDETERLLTLLHAYSFGGLVERLPPLVRGLQARDIVDAEVLYSLALHTWPWAPEEAIAAGTRYLDRFGEDPEVRDYVAFAHTLLGNLEAARSNYDRALELVAEGGSFVEPMFYAGFVYDRMGASERVSEIWRRGLAVTAPIVASHPNNLRFRIFEACFRGLTGDTRFLLSATEDVLSRGANGFEMQLLAVVLARAGYEARAVEVLRESMARGLTDAYWSQQFDLAFVSRDSEAFQVLGRELEALLVPLREKY